MGTYNLQLSGTVPVNPVPELNDVAEVRVYINGAHVGSVPAVPGQSFEISVQHPTAETITLEHSFVDEAGNESAKFSQQVVIPDVAQPQAPVDPLQLVSVVWAA